MPGTKSSGRPGGNPEIKKYGFKTNRKYPLTENESLKLDKPTKEKLKAGLLPNWRDIAREAIVKALAEVEEKQKLEGKIVNQHE